MATPIATKNGKLMPNFFNFMFIVFILLATILLYTPVLINPNILLARGNDLTNFFWPLFYFVKNQLVINHQLPFWNNLFFSGTPLLPDPQAPIFYLPNIIFLFLNKIDTGFVVSIFIHILIAGVGMYLLSRNGFNFSKKTSIITALLYIYSPKLSGYIEAGHFGLIASWAWLPFTFLATILLARKPTFKKLIFLSISLAGLFYTHILIFAIAIFALTALYLYLLGNLKYLALAGLLCFGLIAIAFLPQISWQSDTTRNLLLKSPDVFPKWLTKTEFIKATISPIISGPKFIWDLDTEKTIALGFFASIFALFGFIKLKVKDKYVFEIGLLIPLLISLNNISPFYNFLIQQNWYILLRVSTRFWFIIIFIFIFLAGYGFEKLSKAPKLKFLVNALALMAILELLLTSWTKILKPIIVDSNIVPLSVYQFLSKDKSQFRVFCLTRCLSQRQSAIYGLELADGYGTLQQKNYYEISQQLSQAFYRNRYTLSIPPFEIFEYENLQPYPPNLAAFNIKYVISDHLLKDKNLKLVKQIDKYLIYENKINLPRSNYPISYYSPNFIKIDTSTYKDAKIILSEVYNKDWNAYLNGKQKVEIKETPDKTRQISINKNTQFVNFIYEPGSFKAGLAITFIAVLILL